MQHFYRTLHKWRRAMLYVFLLPVIIVAWYLTVVSRSIEVAGQIEEKNLCMLEVPEFYETGTVEACPSLFMHGPYNLIRDFYNAPRLILLDGSESRVWSAADLRIYAGDDVQVFADDKNWPDIATVTLYVRLKGSGQPLPGRPWQLSSMIQDFIGTAAYGREGSNLRHRYWLATTADRLNDTSADQAESNGLLAGLEKFFRLPGYFINNCIAIKKLYSQEFLPEQNWHKDNLFGAPVLISSYFNTASLQQIRQMLSDFNTKLPFAEFINKIEKKDLSLVFLKELEGSNTRAPGFFISHIDHSRITMWIDENKPGFDQVKKTLTHEYYHALSSAWNKRRTHYKTNENISLEESSANWFAFFCMAEGKGLKSDEEAFFPGRISIWPTTAIPEGANNGHYELYAFIHWLYLKMDLEPAAFLEKLLESSSEGSFKHILEIAGYDSMQKALPEYMAFCWWMSLGSPDNFAEPFNPSFAGLKNKTFFVADSPKNFNSITWDAEKHEYWKFCPNPGCSYFIKGRIETLKSGWELISQVPEDRQTIFMALLSEKKILEIRRLQSLTELDQIRNQLPEEADNWSLWLHYQLPAEDDVKMVEGGQQELIMEMFKSGRKTAIGKP